MPLGDQPFGPVPDIYIIDGNSIYACRSQQPGKISGPFIHADLSLLIKERISCISSLYSAVYIVPHIQHTKRILRFLQKVQPPDLLSGGSLQKQPEGAI